MTKTATCKVTTVVPLNDGTDLVYATDKWTMIERKFRLDRGTLKLGSYVVVSDTETTRSWRMATHIEALIMEYEVKKGKKLTAIEILELRKKAGK